MWMTGTRPGHGPGNAPMPPTIRLQSDSNAHDRPWRVAVEQGFFADEGLEVEYHEDNPKGAAGRVKDFADRWKESQLRDGALEVYPVCEWGAIERVQQLGRGKIIGLDTTVRTGAIMVRKDSTVQTLADLRNLPIAVTWHAGTFYAAIEAMEAAGVPFGEIKLVHASERLDALLSGETKAAALMEPLVSRGVAARPGARAAQGRASAGAPRRDLLRAGRVQGEGRLDARPRLPARCARLRRHRAQQVGQHLLRQRGRRFRRERRRLVGGYFSSGTT